MPQDSIVRVPGIALSVRQPWAWAIIHGGKDIENRTWHAVDSGRMRVGRIAIHASKGLTQIEYRQAAEFMLSIGVTCPAPCNLLRGGIIGAVEVIDIVKTSSSKWFSPAPIASRPRALVLANPQPCAYVPAVGQLGYFNWTPADPPVAPEPARWMLLKDDSLLPATLQFSLFG